MEFEKTEFEQWYDKMYRNLRKVAREHGFTVNVLEKWNKHEKGNFADFVININKDSMLGIKLRPPLSVKPFEIYPYGKIVGLEEIDEVLAEWAVARESH
jgi:hypothetical protein